MVKTRKLIHQWSAILCLTGVTGINAGCNPGYNGAPFPDASYGMKWGEVRLPYVEGMDIPPDLRAGQDFEIVLHVSAQLAPEALTAMSDEMCSSAPRLWPSFYGPRSASYLIRPWSDHLASPDGEPDLVRVRMHGLGPGETVIAVQSAPSREQGGMLGWFFWMPDEDLGPDGFKGPAYQYFTITVLPAEGGGI